MISNTTRQIKALPSFYAGVKFRSRLEARWARYFDLIGVDWQYEPEGYELPSGNYCPDFLCNDSRLQAFYVEVKPDEQGKSLVQQRLIDLCRMLTTTVVCVVGNPSLNGYWSCELLASYGIFEEDETGEAYISPQYTEDSKVFEQEVSFSKYGMAKYGLYWGDSNWSDETFSDDASKMRFENGVAFV